MKRALLISEFASQPWALMPSKLSQLSAVLTNWQAGIEPTAEVMAGIQADRQAVAVRRQEAVKSSAGGGIAVLNLFGIIAQRGNLMSDVSGPGACSLEAFTGQFRQAMADPSIAQILINFDTPGGSVSGVDELASEVFKARTVKPVIGISNSLCASAGYYIASQCSELFCTPSGEVGSIGVYTAHADQSEALKKAGVSVTLVSAGRFKTEANPYGPLDTEAKAAIQKSVDNFYSMFVKAVARGRGVPVATVRNGMGQARCVSATDAVTENMVDAVKSFDEVVRYMQRGAKLAAPKMNQAMRSLRMVEALATATPTRLANAQRAIQIASA